MANEDPLQFDEITPDVIAALLAHFGYDSVVFQMIGDSDLPSCSKSGEDHDLEMSESGDLYRCLKCKRKFIRAA